MSRWSYTTITFNAPDATGDAVSEPSPVLAIKPITTGDVTPDGNYNVRAYWYHPGATNLKFYAHPDTPVSGGAVGSGTESITETVDLSWGVGSHQYPDTQGNTEVVVPGDSNKALSTASVTYPAKYTDFRLSAATVGGKSGVIYFGDRSASAQVSFTVADPDAEVPSPSLSVIPITKGAVLPGAAYQVKVLFYHAVNAGMSTDSPASDPITIVEGVTSTETVNERVTLTWGRGTTQYPDTSGNNDVFIRAYEGDAVEYYDVSYVVNYRLFNFYSDNLGQHSGVIYFSDKSATVQVSFKVAVQSDASGAAMNIKAITSGNVEPNTDFDIRVYYYHPLSAAILTASSPDDPVNISNAGSGTEGITETISLTWGNGNKSLPSADGVQQVTDPLYIDIPLASKQITYDVNYKDYHLSSSSVGSHIALFYFDDRSVTTQTSFTVEDEDVEQPPEPVISTQVVRYKDAKTEAWLPGVAVYLDGALIGSTGADGRLVLGELVVGQTYNIRAVKSGYRDTDLDNIGNDTFTAQE